MAAPVAGRKLGLGEARTRTQTDVTLLTVWTGSAKGGGAVREAARQRERSGVSSIAQEAMRLALEAKKQEKETRAREQRELAAKLRWELRVAKKKAKRRGH